MVNCFLILLFQVLSDVGLRSYWVFFAADCWLYALRLQMDVQIGLGNAVRQLGLFLLFICWLFQFRLASIFRQLWCWFFRIITFFFLFARCRVFKRRLQRRSVVLSLNLGAFQQIWKFIRRVVSLWFLLNYFYRLSF